jgi:hypothetical protein
VKKVKTQCSGEYAKTLRLADRYWFCENCRLCELSSQLPNWDDNAGLDEMTQRINKLYPYKVKIWVGEPNRPTIKQYSTIKEMVEDVCGIGYVAGLNDYGVRVQVFE